MDQRPLGPAGGGEPKQANAGPCPHPLLILRSAIFSDGGLGAEIKIARSHRRQPGGAHRKIYPDFQNGGVDELLSSALSHTPPSCGVKVWPQRLRSPPHGVPLHDSVMFVWRSATSECQIFNPYVALTSRRTREMTQTHRSPSATKGVRPRAHVAFRRGRHADANCTVESLPSNTRPQCTLETS